MTNIKLPHINISSCSEYPMYSQERSDCIIKLLNTHNISSSSITSPQCPNGTFFHYLSPDANGNYPLGNLYIPYPSGMVENMKPYCIKTSVNAKVYCPVGTHQLANGLCETNNLATINQKTPLKYNSQIQTIQSYPNVSQQSVQSYSNVSQQTNNINSTFNLSMFDLIIVAVIILTVFIIII